MGNAEERKACFLLSLADRLGPQSITAMKALAGSYEEAYLQNPEVWRKDGVLKEHQIESLKRSKAQEETYTADYESFLSTGGRLYLREDAEYPKRLRQISDAPAVLMVRGKLPDPEKKAAAIIGARECSDYGKLCASYFAGELARQGITIISGMAVGIDSAAAEGALQAGGDTYAILGSGVDICYPRESLPLYRKLTDPASGFCGGVISEFHPKARGLAKHFVMRNRIIAGLSDVVIVIEAREKSGTLITVGYALDQGKEIFALPGRITDPLGRGCNRLIRDGANVLTEPGDILNCLKLEPIAAQEAAYPGARDTGRLSAEERVIYKVVDYNAMHIEDIAFNAKRSLPETQKVIRMLEQKGFVISTGRAFYRRQ